MAGTSAPIEVDPDLVQPGDDVPAATGNSEVRTPARRFLAAISAAVIVSVASVVVGGIALSHLRAEQSESSRDAQIIDTARQVVVNMVTLRHQSVEEDIQREADGTTGPFHEQFTSSSGSFGDVLNQGQVESTGEVKEAGLVEADEGHAVVLAAVTSTVKNTEAPDGETRVYRMKVTLDSVDEKWLVSDVEFVA